MVDFRSVFPTASDLTPDERATIEASVEEWRAVRDCTAPADRHRAERGIREAYERAGAPGPQEFAWCESPAACAKWVDGLLLRRVTPLARRLKAALAPANANVALLRAIWEPRSEPALLREMTLDLTSHLTDSCVIWDRPHCLVGELVASQLEFVHGKLHDYAIGGQHGCWVDAWSCIRRLLGEDLLARVVGDAWDETKTRLELGEEIARACGWWFPFENVCFVSERPTAVRREDSGRMHAPNGFALEYRDGWGVCAWHGVHVPSAWILDGGNAGPLDVLTWRDRRQRVALMEILGWERITSFFGATVVDDAPDAGTLFGGSLPDGTPLRFLRLPYRHVLRVPVETKTARAAKAWTSSATIPGAPVSGRPGCYLLIRDHHAAEAALRDDNGSGTLRMFQWTEERELTSSGWRFVDPRPQTAFWNVRSNNSAVSYDPTRVIYPS
jgi:hypothetical protein